MHQPLNTGSAWPVPAITVVTPAFNEAGNLPELYRRLSTVLNACGEDWEWILVDDHSQDDTFDVFQALAEQEPHLRAVRFSRNFGSHAAIACGLNHARGNCAIVLAADLQDPPEEIPRLLDAWKGGARVVWAVRGEREARSGVDRLLSRLYFALMRRAKALRSLPPSGADFFLLDRRVLDAFNRFRETNVSILSLLSWMGFRQASIVYDKRARRRGRSGWTWKKKIKVAVDTVTSFTYFPIRLMTYTGFLFALIGFVYLAIVIFNALRGLPPQGWSSLMTVLLFVSAIVMTMLGVLGEYLWRALDESRRRPPYIIEDVIGQAVNGSSGKIVNKST